MGYLCFIFMTSEKQHSNTKDDYNTWMLKVNLQHRLWMAINLQFSIFESLITSFSQLIIIFIFLINKSGPRQVFVKLWSVRIWAKSVKRDRGQALGIRVNVFISTSVSEKNMNPSIVSRPLRQQAKSLYPSGKIRNLWSCKCKLLKNMWLRADAKISNFLGE